MSTRAIVRATCPECGASIDHAGMTSTEIRLDPGRSRCAACDVSYVLREMRSVDVAPDAGATAVEITPGETRWNASNRERCKLPDTQGDKGDRLLRDALGGLV